MRIASVWVAALLLLLSVGSLAGEISIEHRRDIDFSKYKTFAFQPGVPAADESMHDIILAKIEAMLTAAGLRRVDSLEKADLHVLYSVTVTQGVKTEVVQLRPIVTGLPNWDYAPLAKPKWDGKPDLEEGGTSVTRKEFSEGTLVVHLEDGPTSTLIWQGAATETFASGEGPDAAQNKVEATLNLMLRNFPPKPRAK